MGAGGGGGVYKFSLDVNRNTGIEIFDRDWKFQARIVIFDRDWIFLIARPSGNFPESQKILSVEEGKPSPSYWDDIGRDCLHHWVCKFVQVNIQPSWLLLIIGILPRDAENPFLPKPGLLNQDLGSTLSVFRLPQHRVQQIIFSPDPPKNMQIQGFRRARSPPLQQKELKPLLFSIFTPTIPWHQSQHHPARKDGILKSWVIFYAIRWHDIFGIPPSWNILCHPLGKTCLPKKIPVTLRIAEIHYLKNCPAWSLAT